jgi:hypothetical protein
MAKPDLAVILTNFDWPTTFFNHIDDYVHHKTGRLLCNQAHFYYPTTIPRDILRDETLQPEAGAFIELAERLTDRPAFPSVELRPNRMQLMHVPEGKHVKHAAPHSYPSLKKALERTEAGTIFTYESNVALFNKLLMQLKENYNTEFFHLPQTRHVRGGGSIARGPSILESFIPGVEYVQYRRVERASSIGVRESGIIYVEDGAFKNKKIIEITPAPVTVNSVWERASFFLR